MDEKNQPDNYIKGYEHGFRDGWEASKKYFEEQSKPKPFSEEQRIEFDKFIDEI